MHRLTAIAALCIFAGLAAGCASSPVTRFYTLSAAAAPAATSSQLSVVVGPVSVPAVVDRPQIVVTTGPNQVRAAIEVQRFESAPGDAATLDAVWTVSRTKDGKSQTGRTTVREVASDKGYDALAAAHSRGLARLSRDIADAVRTLDRAGQ